jgi:1-acyl-sn-glycerol-3-phosphate acyltransferase
VNGLLKIFRIGVNYRFTGFDWFCIKYPPAWLILFNRHWQHYKPDPYGWSWLEYPLFLVPGGFYLAMLVRGLRVAGQRILFSSRTSKPSAIAPMSDSDYQQAFRAEVLTPLVNHHFQAELRSPIFSSTQGSVIVAMNHAGMCFPWDFVSLAFLLSQEQDGQVQPFAHPLFFDHPWLRWWLPEGWAAVLGGVRADRANLATVLTQSTVLLYAPESWRGLAKGWQKRYQLAPFDSSFVRLSIRHKIPILPIICIGSEGLHPFAINVAWMARRVKLPMFPVSPLILVFLLFPSMGVWAVGSPLRYLPQPLWCPWEDLPTGESAPSTTQMYQLAEALRSRMQEEIHAQIDAEGRR